MASGDKPARRSPSGADTDASGTNRTIPIPPPPAATPPLGDPMDLTPLNTSSTPRSQPDPTLNRNGGNQSDPENCRQSNSRAPTSNVATNGPPAASSGSTIGAAAAAQHPKVVQTAFIHKLYNMLKNENIGHLISWTKKGESFIVLPCNEFSRALSCYFKHTNISSFVRQLNMYGFQKVGDVFHNSSADSPFWEFKHSNGSFKRGNVNGLKEIKRRASRQALVHRDSFPTGPRSAVPSAGAPVDPMADPVESRLQMLEYSVYDLHTRLIRYEDSYAHVNQRCHVLTDSLMRCHQWSYELCNNIKAIIPDVEHPIHRNMSMMQGEITKQSDVFRSTDEQQESIPSARSQCFSNLQNDAMAPASPRQMPQNGQRRSSLVVDAARPTSHRLPGSAVPLHLQASSPRSYATNHQAHYSQSSLRPPPVLHHQQQQPPPPPPQFQHPLANSTSSSPNLCRRHTSADIRLHGWQVPPSLPPPPPHLHHVPSPYASGQNSTPWPSSPYRAPVGGDEQLRHALAQYEITRGGPRPHGGSRNATPPPTEPASTLNPDAGWTLPGARFPFRGIDTSAPPTRRSSMASNVHSLLNPTETAERPEKHEPQTDAKRKRLL